MIINRNFIFIFLFFLIQFFSFTTHSVEPEEVLENVKLLYDVYRSEDTQKILNYIT